MGAWSSGSGSDWPAWLPWVALGLLASAALGATQGYLRFDGTDSWVPMMDALRLLQGPLGDRLYETLFFERQTKFQYPPTSLLPLDALGALGLLDLRLLNLIGLLSCVANAVVLCLIARRLFGHAGGAFRITPRDILVLGAVVLYFPIQRAQQLGQIQTWLDFLFSASALAFLLERKALAGVLVGVATLVKPQFGPLLLLALLMRQWRFAAGFLAATLPLLAVSVLRYGLHNHIAYLEVGSFISRHGESYHANNSVNGIVNRMLFNGNNLEWMPQSFAPYHPVVFAATAISTLLLLLLPFAVRPRGQDRAPALLHYCLGAACFMLASPVAWEHHYGILPALYLAALHAVLALPDGATRRWRLVLLLVSWALTANTLPQLGRLSGTPLNVLQAHLFLGVLPLLLVGFAAIRQPGPSRVPASPPIGAGRRSEV